MEDESEKMNEEYEEEEDGVNSALGIGNENEEVDFSASNNGPPKDQQLSYEKDVQELSKYITIGGMFELRTGRNFSMFNNINTDAFTWKKYPTEIVKNQHDLLELKFNLSDAMLLGSGDSYQNIPELLSRYQLNFNLFKLKKDAYIQCRQNVACS